MRLKITLTLLVILLVLLTYIFYIDPWTEGSGSSDADRNEIATLAVDLDYLRISDFQENRSIALEKIEGEWMLTEPYNWPANAFAVERILTQLQFLDTKVSFGVDRPSQTGSTLAEFGLAPPELSLEFGSGENRYTVGIGNATAVGDHLYLLSVDRSHVHVVDRSLLDSLSIDIESLRNPRIFRFNIFEVDSWNLQLKSANNLRTRVSKTNDQWALETPIRSRADAIEVNTLLGQLLDLKSLRILQPTPTDIALYGLEEPLLRIAVESDQSREALEVGNPVDQNNPTIRYAKLENRDTIFEIEIDTLEQIENAQTNLRDRRIFEIDAIHATSVTFEQGNAESFSLQKLETLEWEILIPDEEQGITRAKGSTEAVEEALGWLNKVTAVATPSSSGFVHDSPTAADLEEYGLEVPEFAISIASTRIKDQDEELDSTLEETLLIGSRSREDRAYRYVKLANADFVYLVSDDILQNIQDEAYRYADRRLYEIPDDASITSLSITRLASGETLLDASAEEGNLPIALMDALSPLTVKLYLSDTYASNIEIAGRRQTWAYQLKATFQWANADAGQTETIEIYLTELTGGPLLAGGSIEKNTRFELRQSFIDAFSEVIFERVKRPIPEEPFDPNRPLDGAAENPPTQADAN